MPESIFVFDYAARSTTGDLWKIAPLTALVGLDLYQTQLAGIVSVELV
jgi:hypothetical protein